MRVYLGTSVLYPPQPNEVGGYALVSDKENIEQSIKDILDTVQGETYFLECRGSKLHMLVGMPNDEVLGSLLEFYTRDELEQWEKRITIITVDTVADGGMRNIIIRYQIKASNEIESFIYPFNTELIF